MSAFHRNPPRPYPFATTAVNQFGVYRFEDFKNESAHVAIGRDGWAPMLYAITLKDLRYGASGSLCRYLDLVRAQAGVAALEEWDTWDAQLRQTWLQRLRKDHELFEVPKSRFRLDTGARGCLADLLFTMKPPHQGVVLSCSREYAAWHQLHEHEAFYGAVLARFDWLQVQVAAEFRAAGFEVDGPLFKLDGFQALYDDDWDIYGF